MDRWLGIARMSRPADDEFRYRDMLYVCMDEGRTTMPKFLVASVLMFSVDGVPMTMKCRRMKFSRVFQEEATRPGWWNGAIEDLERVPAMQDLAAKVVDGNPSVLELDGDVYVSYGDEFVLHGGPGFKDVLSWRSHPDPEYGRTVVYKCRGQRNLLSFSSPSSTATASGEASSATEDRDTADGSEVDNDN